MLRRKIGLFRGQISTADFLSDFSLSANTALPKEQGSRSRFADCLSARDIPSANSLDRITGRVCNPSQKYMLAGLPGPAGWRPRRETTISRRHGLRRGGRKKEEEKKEEERKRRRILCANILLAPRMF